MNDDVCMLFSSVTETGRNVKVENGTRVGKSNCPAKECGNVCLAASSGKKLHKKMNNKCRFRQKEPSRWRDLTQNTAELCVNMESTPSTWWLFSSPHLFVSLGLLWFQRRRQRHYVHQSLLPFPLRTLPLKTHFREQEKEKKEMTQVPKWMSHPRGNLTLHLVIQGKLCPSYCHHQL